MIHALSEVVNQVRAYMSSYLEGVPEFRFEIAEWAERDSTVFVEARNTGRPGGGERLEWGTVYCVTLRGDRVLHGRAYGDRVPLLARLTPGLTLAQAAAIGAPMLTSGEHRLKKMNPSELDRIGCFMNRMMVPRENPCVSPPPPHAGPTRVPADKVPGHSDW